MASGTINELDGLLKVTYFGSENEQMAVGNAWETRLQAFGRQMEVAGEDASFTTNYTRSRGVGFRNSTEAIPDLPEAGTGKFKQITLSIPEFYAHEQFSERQLKSAKGNGAFVSTVVNKTDQLMRDMRDALGISLYNKKDGAITYVSTNNTLNATSLVVKDKVRLQEGNYVDIIDSDGTTVLFKKLQVSAFDIDTKTVTFDFTDATDGADASVANFGAADTVAAGDYFVYEDSNGLSYTGLEAQVGEQDTTIHNINRANFKYYNPAHQAGGSAVMDNAVIRKLKNKIKLTSRGSYGFKLDCILTTPGIASGFEDTLQDQVRYEVMQGDKAPNLTAGYEVLRHDDLDVMDDRYATDGIAYVLSTPSFVQAEMAATQFIDYDGKLFSRIPGKPAYEFGLLNMMELMSEHLRANGAITALAELA